MHQLKIKAPVNSLESAKSQISAGADEIYLGLFSPEWFTNLSFSHRGKSNLSTDTNGCLSSVDELRKIVDYAHENGKKVSYTANLFNLPDSRPNEAFPKTLVQGYIDYVKNGVSCGIDSIIVSNLNEILQIQKAGITTPLAASCLFMVSNEYDYKLLRDLNVKSVFLPHDTTIQEMRKMVELSEVETEPVEIGVFGHLSCAMLSGGCHLYHKFGEEINLGYPCRNLYTVRQGHYCNDESFLDLNTDCTICQLKEIIDTGIASFKLVGRSSGIRMNARMTRIYRYLIDGIFSGGDLKQLRADIVQKYPWWKALYCSHQSCKYSAKNPLFEYAIG